MKFAILLISIYIVSLNVNCISELSCDFKCKIVNPHIDSLMLHGHVVNNTCRCAKSLKILKKDHKPIKFCTEYNNLKHLHNISSLNCYFDIKCDVNLCDLYCNYENPEQRYLAYCHDNYECKCLLEIPQIILV